MRCLSLIFLSVLVTGCNAFDFELHQPFDEVVVQGDPDLFAQAYPLPADIIPAQTWSYDLEQKPVAIFLEDLTLTMTDTVGPPNATFEFVKQIHFYVESTKPDTELEQHLIGFAKPLSTDTTVTMDVNFALNLVPYIEEGIRITSILDGCVPSSTISFEGEALLSVDVF